MHRNIVSLNKHFGRQRFQTCRLPTAKTLPAIIKTNKILSKLTRSLLIIILFFLKCQIFGQLPGLRYIKDTCNFENTKHIYCFNCQTDSFLYLKTNADYLKVTTFEHPHCNDDVTKYLKAKLKCIKKFKNLNEIILSFDPDTPKYGQQVEKKLWKYFLTNHNVKRIYITSPEYFKEFIEYCKINRPEIQIIRVSINDCEYYHN